MPTYAEEVEYTSEELSPIKTEIHHKKLLIMLMIFVIGGVFGFVYEEIFYRIDLGQFVKRGTTFGPWIPIYGFGALLIVITTERFKKHPTAVFMVSACVCGILEYVAGFFLFKYLNLRLWDYNTEIWNWFNVGGFICLRSVGFFGLSSLFLQYIIYPNVLSFVDARTKKTVYTVAFVPAILFAGDIIISLIYNAI